MSRVCESCGKRTQVGNKITKRGKAKYLGGVGTKITGKVKRKFKPNLQRIRVEMGGTRRRAWLCTRCIRGGRGRKPMARSHPAAVS